MFALSTGIENEVMKDKGLCDDTMEDCDSKVWDTSDTCKISTPGTISTPEKLCTSDLYPLFLRKAFAKP